MRCELCRARLPTSRKLLRHYLSKHSKFKLAREILKMSAEKAAMPKIKKPYIKTQIKNIADNTETIFSKDNVQIFCRNNEIIIKGDKSIVDMDISFDDDDDESNEDKVEKKFAKEVNNNTNDSNKSKKPLAIKTKKRPAKLLLTSSSSASSEDSVNKQFSFKKRVIRKKRDTSHYRINITRTKNYYSLNENTGKFYSCQCREDNGKNIEDIANLKLTSDTESASEASASGIFCIKCGNGYKNENLLLEHMKIHETHCRVCNKIYPTEESFKEHIQTHMFKVFLCHLCNYESPAKAIFQRHFESHMEDSILESVIDMEEDYNIVIPPNNAGYQNSINNILSYLTDNNLHNNINNIDKIFCDICFTEVFSVEYESHMQIVHQIYRCNSTNNN